MYYKVIYNNVVENSVLICYTVCAIKKAIVLHRGDDPI